MFFFQAEDGIRDLVRSRGLGDVYKRQEQRRAVDDHAVGADLVDDRMGRAGAMVAARKGIELSLIHI